MMFFGSLKRVNRRFEAYIHQDYLHQDIDEELLAVLLQAAVENANLVDFGISSLDDDIWGEIKFQLKLNRADAPFLVPHLCPAIYGLSSWLQWHPTRMARMPCFARFASIFHLPSRVKGRRSWVEGHRSWSVRLNEHVTDRYTVIIMLKHFACTTT
jgi:hypothetical protein